MLIVITNMADETVSTISSDDHKIFFKKKKARSLRKTNSDDDEEDDTTASKLNEMKFIQKLRERPRGVNITEAGIEQTLAKPEPRDEVDPFKVKSGGMINMKNVTVSNVDDAYDVGIGTQFSAETNKRDEDEEMMKYIEHQLSKKKQAARGSESSTDAEKAIYYSPEDAALASLPDHLRAPSTHRSEEMLSNQMLSGIPEIDLGIESKIKNIEATEDAKLKLVRSQGRKSDAPSQFVPTNITVNFAQPTKLNVEDPEVKKEETNRTGKRSATQKATDDFHYEKFKKQFRRY